MFCNKCGKEIPDGAVACPFCGVPQGGAASPAKGEGHSFVVTLLLCWLLGVFGVHRFYTGHILIGVIQLLTCGGLGIWVSIDFILIIAGSYVDSDGKRLVH